ncbi:MAG: PLDc N-terminal domain-containing protein [Candidatus Thiothrix singaporensis]|uniref:PLDc N-terminal domain-containing protein n=1 Tax=Candidatus Thiothrix singaporensis TaxID=2799669 RepID=A0A7L6APN6_9GAMM|nr:MAG: PLDc N-terminal domain-containing protein [Candidatus Thiothrix singaporensis]
MATAAFIDWSDSSVWLLLLPTLHVLMVLAGVAHVLMQKPKVGIAFAWIILIIAFPVAGITLYLLVGERRISLRRRKSWNRRGGMFRCHQRNPGGGTHCLPVP